MLVALGMNHTLWGMGQSDSLSRAEGIFFLLAFAAYLWYCFKFGSKSENEPSGQKPVRISMAVTLIILGLAALIFGGEMLVKNATKLAKAVGASDKFIAVTILAGGTSFPELATSIVAASKRKDQLALGNILGSNVFNILFILGCSSIITPLSFSGMDLVDAGMLVLSSAVLLLWAYTGKKCRIDRWEGAVMLLLFTAYYYYLFTKI